MGNTHIWTSNGKWLDQKHVDDIKKLVATAEKEFGVKLYGDLAFSRGEYNSRGEQVAVGHGEPTIHSARIAFSAPGQGDVDIRFNERGGDFIQTQGAQKLSHEADMLTGAIMLYLAEAGKIDYEPSGISLDTSGGGQLLTVDADIHDSYNFVENVLGEATLDDIGAIALRGLDDYIDVDEPYALEVKDGSIPWAKSVQANKVPIDGRGTNPSFGSTLARCNAWMPRANESCVLIIAHAGAHRSR